MVCQRDFVAQLDGEKVRGTVYANEENEPKGNRAGSVCRGYDDVVN